MSKRVNNIINSIMYGSIGLFIVSVVHRLLYYKGNTHLFEAQSAPWYLSIEICAIILDFVLVICTVIKAIIKRCYK